MIQSRFLWLGGLLACAALIAGCGSSSSTTSSQSTSSAASSTPAATTSSTSSPTQSAPTSTGTPTNSATIQAAIAACKQTIAAESTLPAGAKAKLEAVCGKAAKGDTAAVKQAAREVCEEVINKSPIPAGASKEQALASCKAK
jgi:hypothetical protein